MKSIRGVAPFWRWLSLGALLVALFANVGAASATNGKVLILDPTVTNGALSLEAGAATAAGHGVDVVGNAAWSAMTQAQFADYDAIILGDATCTDLGAAAAAEANAGVWGAAVNGNVIVVGTDPVFHQAQGGAQLVTSGVKFAGDAAGKTGAYVDLSCYYHDTAPGTPVPLLSGIGAFTVTGVGCYNDVHIVATHPALAGLSDANLENWFCSVHEAFDGFPADFLPLVIADDPVGGPPLPGSLPFPDGSRGVPYVMARGEGLVFISNITLAPGTATNEVGTPHTVSATVKENDTPIAGTTVTFSVLSGPSIGLTGTAATDSAGVASFTYTSASAGVDTIEASYVDSTSALKKSNVVSKEWIVPPNQPPDCSTVTLDKTSLWPPNHKLVTVAASGATDPDGDAVTIVIGAVTQDEPVNGLGDGNTAPDAVLAAPASNKVQVRAERSGLGDGRVYRLSFTATDPSGATCTGTLTVGVPHDQRGAPAVDSAPPSFNSLTP